MPMLLAWAQFAVCVVVIALAGARLVRHGDAIAALTGLSRNWIGLVLVATVTSLPELVTGLSSVTVAAAPDIAIGDALGSCLFNLAILAVVDLLHREGSVYARAERGHVVSAAYGVILLGVAGVGVLLSAREPLPSIGHVSIASLVLLALYLLAMRTVYRTQQGGVAPAGPPRANATLQKALTGYVVNAAVIMAAGIWLPLVGVELARIMGWSTSFVGSLFIAFATSVPELATTLGALRIGAIDLAFGNLLGSNLFDLLIVAFDDIAYLRGPIFSDVAQVHAASALAACMMNGAVILALVCRPATRVLRTMSWSSVALLMLYMLNAVVQYRHGQ